MSDGSQIQWTDATWNPTTGCTKVSPGCAHCYIERTPAFRIPGRKFVNGATDLQLHANRLEQPLHWRKPRRIFVNSLSDLFHPDVPDAFIDQVFAVMALCPQHMFQVLTKRPARMRAYASAFETHEHVQRAIEALAVPEDIRTGVRHDERTPLTKFQRWQIRGKQQAWQPLCTWPLPNVWLGVSVENQHFADERIPLLLQTPAAVRFISAEPLLGPVDLESWLIAHVLTDSGWHSWPKLDWVIVGGESGPSSRTFDLAWAKSIVQQCQASGVACFVKQLGDLPAMNEQEWVSGSGLRLLSARNDKRVPAGTVPLKFYAHKAGDPAEWPSDIRVREYPQGNV